MFPKIVVPQNGWFIIENPIKHGMIWGYHYFWKHTHIYIYRYIYIYISGTQRPTMFEGQSPPQTRPKFQSKQGAPFGFQVHIYIYVRWTFMYYLNVTFRHLFNLPLKKKAGLPFIYHSKRKLVGRACFFFFDFFVFFEFWPSPERKLVGMACFFFDFFVFFDFFDFFEFWSSRKFKKIKKIKKKC